LQARPKSTSLFTTAPHLHTGHIGCICTLLGIVAITTFCLPQALHPAAAFDLASHLPEHPHPAPELHESAPFVDPRPLSTRSRIRPDDQSWTADQHNTEHLNRDAWSPSKHYPNTHLRLPAAAASHLELARRTGKHRIASASPTWTRPRTRDRAPDPGMLVAVHCARRTTTQPCDSS
jgi:hypothetical protein